MTQSGKTYGEALYSLCQDEQLTDTVLVQLKDILGIFQENPEYVRLLASPAISKQARCDLLDQAFRDHVHIYVLNFLKILTENGDIRNYSDCYCSFLAQYQRDQGILPVTAVSAVALTRAQSLRLQEKLEAITGKTIELTNQVDPAVLGGMRLDFDGKRLDDTIAHRLDAVRSLLQNTVL